MSKPSHYANFTVELGNGKISIIPVYFIKTKAGNEFSFSVGRITASANEVGELFKLIINSLPNNINGKIEKDTKFKFYLPDEKMWKDDKIGGIILNAINNFLNNSQAQPIKQTFRQYDFVLYNGIVSRVESTTISAPKILISYNEYNHTTKKYVLQTPDVLDSEISHWEFKDNDEYQISDSSHVNPYIAKLEKNNNEYGIRDVSDGTLDYYDNEQINIAKYLYARGGTKISVATKKATTQTKKPFKKFDYVLYNGIVSAIDSEATFVAPYSISYKYYDDDTHNYQTTKILANENQLTHWEFKEGDEYIITNLNGNDYVVRLEKDTHDYLIKDDISGLIDYSNPQPINIAGYLFARGATKRMVAATQATTPTNTNTQNFKEFDIVVILKDKLIGEITSVNKNANTVIVSSKKLNTTTKELDEQENLFTTDEIALWKFKVGDSYDIFSSASNRNYIEIELKKKGSNLKKGADFIVWDVEDDEVRTISKNESEIGKFLQLHGARALDTTQTTTQTNTNTQNIKEGDIVIILKDKLVGKVDIIYELAVLVKFTKVDKYTNSFKEDKDVFYFDDIVLWKFKDGDKYNMYSTPSNNFEVELQKISQYFIINKEDDDSVITRTLDENKIGDWLFLKGATALNKVVKTPISKKPKASELTIPATNQEAEVEQLNKDIAQLMFFKSILSPIDFEKKIELSQEIRKKQKRVNDLNFYMLEKKISGQNIFEELFEQSFTPIKNVYDNVYAKSSDETDFFAPDGQKSKLSDNLNVMIRTPQFKAWFGDWELAYIYRDTDAIEIECSKVLSDNAEPLVVWHGTGQEFSYFKFETFPAAYFAVNREYSQFFADLHGGGDGYVIPFFLNIRNPLDLTHFGTNDISTKDFFDYIFLQTGLDMDDLEVSPIFMDKSMKPLQTWIYIRNNANMLKKIGDLNVFDGIRFFETNPNIKDTNSPEYRTEAFITFKADQSKIADPDRGMILLASMKSFLLEKGGQI